MGQPSARAASRGGRAAGRRGCLHADFDRGRAVVEEKPPLNQTDLTGRDSCSLASTFCKIADAFSNHPAAYAVQHQGELATKCLAGTGLGTVASIGEALFKKRKNVIRDLLTVTRLTNRIKKNGVRGPSSTFLIKREAALGRLAKIGVNAGNMSSWGTIAGCVGGIAGLAL